MLPETFLNKRWNSVLLQFVLVLVLIIGNICGA